MNMDNFMHRVVLAFAEALLRDVRRDKPDFETVEFRQSRDISVHQVPERGKREEELLPFENHDTWPGQ